MLGRGAQRCRTGRAFASSMPGPVTLRDCRAMGDPGAPRTCCSCLMLLLLPIFSRWALKAWMLAAPSEKRRTGEKRSVGRCRVLESL